MKSVFKNYILLTLGLLIVSFASAQCSNFVANYPAGTFTTSNTNWQTVTTCAYGGEFQRFEVLDGATYQFRTCVGTFFDSEITLWDASHTNVLGFETNNCVGNQGLITWTATFSGEVNLLVTQNGCQTNTSCARVQFRMTSPPPTPQNNTPCSAKNIDVGTSCAFEEVVLAGATASGVASPPCSGNAVADVWYRAIVPPSGAVVISTQEGSVRDAVMEIYSGACNSLTAIACSDDVNNRMPEISQLGLVPGSVLYIRLLTYGDQEQGTFDLCIYELCTSAPSNDLICDALSISLGSTESGRNDCSGDVGESWVPSCWSGGIVNSVWYSFTAPAGGQVSISTSPEGQLATQIALFSGDCSSLTEINCNQSTGEGCGAAGGSAISASGLTPGVQYFVMVDGQDDQVGYFDILVSNATGVSPQSGSDCGSPIPLCSDIISYADPGPQGTGAFCDFDGANDCTGGERNSIWYQIEVGATGNLNFTITPNDASSNSCITETDYDFVIWKISGQGQTTDCGGISNDASRGLLACNYSDLGVTGVAAGGNSPSPFSNCFDSAFEPTLSVTNGDVLLLVIQNFQGSTTGFNLDLSSSDPGVVNSGIPSVVYWNGGTDIDWDESENWGNCSTIPSCSVSAVVPASAGTWPNIQGAHSVENLTIETGATLKMAAGSKLHICGDFVNNGNLEIDPTATILFDNWAVQQSLSGNLAGSNALGNLTIEKSGGWVTLHSTLEVKGDFITSNSTSQIRTRQNEVLIGGDFINAAGKFTYKGVGGISRLVFNGSSSQRYNQGSSNLDLGTVVLNKPGGRLELVSHLRMGKNAGNLDLISGIIETGNRKVYIRNRSASSLNAGNPNSYIEGKLQRFLNPTGLYHFPVGHAATGYQLADVTFRSVGFDYITARHSPWSTIAGPLNIMDCSGGYNLDALDNGFFTLTANNNPTSADYDISLYNYNYSNTAGAQGWTVMKDSGSGWMLDGNCVGSSTADATHRTDLTGFSRFATAQASTPLPIELLGFDGIAKEDGNQLEWASATEIDNLGFTIESSRDALTFLPIGELEGAGNSNVQIDYEFLDGDALPGLTYYRLKQMDFSGATELSHIIAIEREGKGLEISTYPNPAEDILHFRMPTEDILINEIQITNLIGQVVWNNQFSGENLSKELKVIDISSLVAGHYSINAYGSSGQLLFRSAFVKR